MKTMKTKKKDIRTLAALLVASATFAACSSDDILNDQTTNTSNDQKVYTMTVQVTKTNGDDATTRGLSLDGKTLNVTWNANEEVEVLQKTEVTPITWTSLGKLKAKASDNGSTTLTGQLTALKTNSSSTYPLLFVLHSIDMDYKNQNGVLDRDDNATKSIEDKYDNAMSAEVTNYTVDNENNIITVSGSVTLTSRQAIVKFTLEDVVTGNPVKATSLKIKGSKYMTESLSMTEGAKLTQELTITPASATAAIYVAIALPTDNNLTLTATDEDGKTYTYEKSGVTFTEGKYYDVKVKMVPEGVVNLAKLTGDYEAKNGDVLYGTLGGRYKITIADGATVTLGKVSINADGAWTSDEWAGITCLGDATIILKGTNTVKGFHNQYPGIQAGPENKTLTIQGTDADQLTASCNSNSMTYGAGIGGAKEINCGHIVIEGGNITAQARGGANIGSGGDASCGDITISGGIVDATFSSGLVGIGAASRCGNITISGGTITATGNAGGAGIGCSALGQCGNITISGGTVTATGNSMAAGIGNGTTYNSTCGDISITTGVTQVKATRGADATYCIGLGYVPKNEVSNNYTCGTVTIGGNEYYNGSTKTWNAEREDELKVSTFNYPPVIVNLASLSADYEAQDGDILTGDIKSSHKITIADGATVTLRNANIQKNAGNDFAGITPVGDATIVLEGTNTVEGNEPTIYMAYAAVQGAPVGKTLTIKGNGSLTATATDAAGIGGSYQMNCGNIVIEGNPTINARGTHAAAGIGGSYCSSCGDIIIKGGDITAECLYSSGYKSYAGGIGGGAGDYTVLPSPSETRSSCGKIIITSDVTKVKATKGWSDKYTLYSIGPGDRCDCGTITIGCTLDSNGNPVGGTTYYDGTNFVNDGATYLAASPFTYPAQ